MQNAAVAWFRNDNNNKQIRNKTAYVFMAVSSRLYHSGCNEGVGEKEKVRKEEKIRKLGVKLLRLGQSANTYRWERTMESCNRNARALLLFFSFRLCSE